MPKSNVPEPLRSLQAFVKAARKAEREDSQKRSAGEILFGSVTHKGKKRLSKLAEDMDEIINTVALVEFVKQEQSQSERAK